MNHKPTGLAGTTRFLDRNFLWLLLSSYVLAALLPEPGLWVRGMSLGQVTLLGESVVFSLPMLLLALLLFNAGLEVPAGEIRHLLRRPTTLFAGLVANWLVPVGYILILAQALRLWHEPEEAQSILIGLALIAAMPIAGSSTAWARKSNGNLALSLGLVLLSTFLSPLATPLVLYAVSLFVPGDAVTDLQSLAGNGTGMFLFLCVLAPTLLGMLTLRAAGKERLAAAKPSLKLFNSVVLLLLVYTNAAASLPQVLYGTAPTFLALLLAVAVSFCVAAFLAGWLVARFVGAEPAEERSLMFGLGMNNNGTGMVLASAALGDHALVLLLIVCYNLVQHLVAGGVDYAFVRRPAPAPETDEAPLSWRQALRPVLSSSFILVTALVLANAGASYWNIRLMASNHRRVVRTQEVLRLLQGTLLLLRDAETVQRDYLLSGDARYLPAYEAAQSQAEQKLRQLDRHTRDNPEQHDRVQILEGRVHERFAELGAMIAVRRDHGLEAAGQAVLADRAKEGMGAVRAVMGEIEEHEESRLEQRTADSDARVARALGTVVLMGLVLLVYTFVRRLGSVQRRARRLPAPHFVNLATPAGRVISPR